MTDRSIIPCALTKTGVADGLVDFSDVTAVIERSSGIEEERDLAGGRSTAEHCEATSGRSFSIHPSSLIVFFALPPSLFRFFRYLISMLLFKKKFLEAIRTSEKTQTVRLWKYCRMRAGQRSYIPGAGYIRVTGITEVCLDALTDDDARPDGFESADLLRRNRPALSRAPCRGLQGVQNCISASPGRRTVQEA